MPVLAAGRGSGRREKGFSCPWEDMQFLNNTASRPFFEENVDKNGTLGVFSCVLWHTWRKPGIAAPLQLAKEAQE